MMTASKQSAHTRRTQVGLRLLYATGVLSLLVFGGLTAGCKTIPVVIQIPTPQVGWTTNTVSTTGIVSDVTAPAAGGTLEQRLQAAKAEEAAQGFTHEAVMDCLVVNKSVTATRWHYTLTGCSWSTRDDPHDPGKKLQGIVCVYWKDGSVWKHGGKDSGKFDHFRPNSAERDFKNFSDPKYAQNKPPAGVPVALIHLSYDKQRRSNAVFVQSQW